MHEPVRYGPDTATAYDFVLSLRGTQALLAGLDETAATQARELLLPILVFPLIVPIVIAAVRATGALMVVTANEPPWLGLIAAFDAIFLSLSTILFEYVIEE